MCFLTSKARMMITSTERITSAPVTTPTRVSTVTPAWFWLVCRWDNTAEEGEEEVATVILVTTSVVVVVVEVVVGRHSGATGSPSSLVGENIKITRVLRLVTD